MCPMRPIRFLLLFFMAMGCASGLAQSGIVDDSLAKKLGGGYAAIINFAENPDITTARYYIDDPRGDDPTLRVVRLGGRHEFKLQNHNWVPFVQVIVPYQTLDAGLTIGTNGTVRSTWSALGAVFSTGLTMPATERLRISPALSWGYVRLENKADYSGNVAAVKPLLKGILFDWASDAWVAGASIEADYNRPVGAKLLTVHAGATHNLIETFDTPRGQVEFSSYATTLSLKSELTSPTRHKMMGNPLAVVTMMGATAFIGPNRDQLGFDSFMDAGLALETDLTQHGWRVKKVRIGAKGIYGEDVIGWSAIFSWKF